MKHHLHETMRVLHMNGHVGAGAPLHSPSVPSLASMSSFHLPSPTSSSCRSHLHVISSTRLTSILRWSTATYAKIGVNMIPMGGWIEVTSGFMLLPRQKGCDCIFQSKLSLHRPYPAAHFPRHFGFRVCRSRRYYCSVPFHSFVMNLNTMNLGVGVEPHREQPNSNVY